MVSSYPFIFGYYLKAVSYDCLKIFHIVSATLLLTSLVYSIYLWRSMQQPEGIAMTSSRIQTQTWLIIVPIAIIQLISGFTMISLHHTDLAPLWTKGSVLGFVIAISSWFGFIYFLISPQQNRRIQFIMLLLCAAALLSMVFFMTTKIGA